VEDGLVTHKKIKIWRPNLPFTRDRSPILSLVSSNIRIHPSVPLTKVRNHPHKREGVTHPLRGVGLVVYSCKGETHLLHTFCRVIGMGLPPPHKGPHLLRRHGVGCPSPVCSSQKRERETHLPPREEHGSCHLWRSASNRCFHFYFFFFFCGLGGEGGGIFYFCFFYVLETLSF
jgi:hypothetical protein